MTLRRHILVSIHALTRVKIVVNRRSNFKTIISDTFASLMIESVHVSLCHIHIKAFGLGSYNIIMLTNSRTSHTTGNEQIQFTRALI